MLFCRFGELKISVRKINKNIVMTIQWMGFHRETGTQLLKQSRLLKMVG